MNCSLMDSVWSSWLLLYYVPDEHDSFYSKSAVIDSLPHMLYDFFRHIKNVIFILCLSQVLLMHNWWSIKMTIVPKATKSALKFKVNRLWGIIYRFQKNSSITLCFYYSIITLNHNSIHTLIFCYITNRKRSIRPLKKAHTNIPQYSQIFFYTLSVVAKTIVATFNIPTHGYTWSSNISKINEID